MFNFKGVLQASLTSTVIGVALVLLIALLMIVGHFLGPTEEGRIVGLITLAISVLLMPVYFLLYLWTGYRGKKRFGLRTREAGLSTAVAYGIAGFVYLVLSAILSILKVGDALRYQLSPEMVGLPPVLGDELWVVSTTFCALGGLAIGVILNFVIGMCGAIISESR